ncbi:hypothetical protein CIB84_013864 [Bambusicola thoracicus]|uniref:Uncharacterized protein n=1 Tax=Bambusicola thoracicus TaxID=9083 RepID=A0A2P4SE50_BAMTH|nr:hypothetical protein CIB84_013864 [Bambusicola thoracicus]
MGYITLMCAQQLYSNHPQLQKIN